MAISGGGDRSELRPLKRDGNLDHDEPGVLVGNHKGQYGYFNILDPKPGTVHQWTTDDQYLGCMQRGWWPAEEGDGRPAYSLMMKYTSETGSPFPGYRHVVTSEENFRALQRERQEESQRQLAEASAGYLDQVSEHEFAMTRGAGRNRPSRFATKWHETTVQEGDSTLAHLTPNGILREEDI